MTLAGLLGMGIFIVGLATVALGLLATMHGDEQVEACRAPAFTIEGSDDQRCEALRFVGHRPGLTAALLPEWGIERRGPIEYWLQAERHRPIDEV
ncbi:MAG: hypothetical protein NCW75_09120 [Phycisphaera sp.]|nr:MAG: hypothetical protein NCW75_09120 [Phycisphaera sp.]